MQCQEWVTASNQLHGWLIANQGCSQDPTPPPLPGEACTHGVQCASPPQGLLTLALRQPPHLKMNTPFPLLAAVPLGEGVLQSQVTAPSPTSSRPGCFGSPFYRPVPLLPHISLLGCAYSSHRGVKNTSLPLIIHLGRSRQDFDLKGKAFPGLWLHETHAKRAPRHQALSLLGKFS